VFTQVNLLVNSGTNAVEWRPQFWTASGRTSLIGDLRAEILSTLVDLLPLLNIMERARAIYVTRDPLWVHQTTHNCAEMIANLYDYQSLSHETDEFRQNTCGVIVDLIQLMCIFLFGVCHIPHKHTYPHTREEWFDLMHSAAIDINIMKQSAILAIHGEHREYNHNEWEERLRVVPNLMDRINAADPHESLETHTHTPPPPTPQYTHSNQKLHVL